MATESLQRSETRVGILNGLAAYLWWGFVPIYFKAVAHIAPLEVLAHRILWCVPMLGVWIALRGRAGGLREALTHRRTLLALCGTTVLIAVNWFVFIWAVGNGLVLQASLGYFINPLVNVLLGMIFLGERLRRAQWASVLLATAAVAFLTISYGRLPVVALLLAGSFGFYGLLRKTARVDSTVGLFVETALLLPLALAYLGWCASAGTLHFASATRIDDLLLLAAGPVTALPLLWFVNAARRVTLTTLGFMQYLAPSLHFTLAVVVYAEPFTTATLVTFAGIWTALAIFTVDSVREARRRRTATATS